MHVEATQMGGFGHAKKWAALAVLILVLMGIASEKLHRMWWVTAAPLAPFVLLETIRFLCSHVLRFHALT